MSQLYDDAFLYDLVHGQFAQPYLLDFYLKYISQAGSPVLELACGTGRILIPLVEKGIDIYGLDISPEMLETCHKKAKERNISVNADQGDMRHFEFDSQFNLIFVAANSFQHLAELKDIQACFDSIKKNLAPGGKFIFDVLNPYIPLLAHNPNKQIMVGSYEDYVLTMDFRYDVASQTNFINWNFLHRPTNNFKSLSFQLRQFFPQELDALLEFNGFQIENKFGDYDESAFTGSSPKQVIVAKPLA
jgi:SAM-dependent methyltransferase